MDPAGHLCGYKFFQNLLHILLQISSVDKAESYNSSFQFLIDLVYSFVFVSCQLLTSAPSTTGPCTFV